MPAQHLCLSARTRNARASVHHQVTAQCPSVRHRPQRLSPSVCACPQARATRVHRSATKRRRTALPSPTGHSPAPIRPCLSARTRNARASRATKRTPQSSLCRQSWRVRMPAQYLCLSARTRSARARGPPSDGAAPFCSPPPTAAEPIHPCLSAGTRNARASPTTKPRRCALPSATGRHSCRAHPSVPARLSARTQQARASTRHRRASPTRHRPTRAPPARPPAGAPSPMSVARSANPSQPPSPPSNVQIPARRLLRPAHAVCLARKAARCLDLPPPSLQSCGFGLWLPSARTWRSSHPWAPPAAAG